MSQKEYNCLDCGKFFSAEKKEHTAIICPACQSEKVELILLKNNNEGCCSDKDSCDIRCKPVGNDKPSCSCGGNC